MLYIMRKICHVKGELLGTTEKSILGVHVAMLKQMCSNSKRTTSEELNVVKHQFS